MSPLELFPKKKSGHPEAVRVLRFHDHGQTSRPPAVYKILCKHHLIPGTTPITHVPVVNITARGLLIAGKNKLQQEGVQSIRLSIISSWEFIARLKVLINLIDANQPALVASDCNRSSINPRRLRNSLRTLHPATKRCTACFTAK